MVALERDLTHKAPQPAADAIPASLRRGGASPRQVLATSLIGIAVLTLFASRDLSSWAERLSGPLAEQMQNIAAGWDGAMTTLGLTRPYDTLRAAMGHFLDSHWDNDQ